MAISSTARRVALGLSLAAVANLIAFFLAGAGHGWTTALLVSFSLWVIIPIALSTLRTGSRALLLIVLAIGLAADVVLVHYTLTFREDLALRSYLRATGSFGWTNVMLWLALLLFWQILLARRLLAGSVDA